ncbi:haloacid dehalogenase type II [Coraliomargarita sp. SDUM461003]|uniref:Haloacid dehalogenase type II n=1 Tax=Thalassobacterium maritimum TaxID=3041265 RepID=A0ABU1AZ42_9BACT|nr:haloacid dehalogenase type II [Coraliomargarita sp. SDUM461003]MDQ8209429.1 haloacid dehalogenase type II [Coraliomargarita sp. SDUM461003]
MIQPTVLLFDVNETLLDLRPLRKSIGHALGGREDLLPLWFSTMLHYSLVETLTQDFHGFDEIGTAALRMLAETQQIELSAEAAQEAVVGPLNSLPPHPEVLAALQQLRQQGYRLATLTNSSASGAQAQLSNAGIEPLLDNSYSVESVRKYKPHSGVYRMVLDDLALEPEQVLMVAAHAWDLAGAKNVGLQTAFIQRPGTALYPNTARPDYVLRDLTELAQRLA